MNKEFEIYTNKIVSLIGINGRKAKQIREDIYSSLIEKQQSTGESDPYKLMGFPEDVAEEFKDNLGIKKEASMFAYNFYYAYEYKSKTTLFGVPLVHINFKRFGIAKGIIAVGNIAIGIIACGAFSMGLFSFGGFALALLLGVGGISVSAIASFGGMAISGLISFGGFAAAKYIAAGGYASASIAIGGAAKGIISIYNQNGTGRYLFKSPADLENVLTAVKIVHPKIGNSMLNFIKFLVQNFR